METNWKDFKRPTVHWINIVVYSYRGITQKSDWTTAAHVNKEESQWWKKQVAEEYIHGGSVSVKVKTRPLNIW